MHFCNLASKMEVEKPFKCSVCSSRFTNEDHLQVHKKRHEMSLNLSKSGNTNVADGFVDETPTPTRFIRNCEEVGLFQDLQNVNPFDEQFKAASATPSTENFEFNFSVSLTKKSSYEDTLNTPQVFGYTVSSSTVPTPSTADTSSIIQNPGISTTSSPAIVDGESPDLEKDVISPLSATKSLAIACTAEEAKVESTTPDNESFIPPIFGLKTHDNLHLELGSVDSNSGDLLSQNILENEKRLKDVNEGVAVAEEDESDAYGSDQPRPTKVSRKSLDVKKVELLERNRAAASRSRERKKQWVSGLETRCQTMQALLSSAQIEVAKLRAENKFLREELGKHSNCDVTRAEPRSRVTLPRTPEFQPQIFKHSSPTSASQLMRTSPGTSNGISTSGASTGIIALSPSPVSASVMLKSAVPPAVPVKPKRGRPRKGHEKRVGGICIPSPKGPLVAPPSTAATNELPVKVEILPVKSADGKPITNVYILKHGV